MTRLYPKFTSRIPIFSRAATPNPGPATSSEGEFESVGAPDGRGGPEAHPVQGLGGLNSRYVSFCPEIDIASQGATIEEAHDNLREALELFFETASPKEKQTRLHDEVYVTRVEVAIG
jgi:predicted RNase H-like HicB family nuclease